MFAKRQSALAAAAGAPPAPKGPLVNAAVLKALVRKPPFIVGAAGLFLLSAMALFVVVLGDPRAGVPSARVALKRERPAATAPARIVLKGQGAASGPPNASLSPLHRAPWLRPLPSCRACANKPG